MLSSASLPSIKYCGDSVRKDSLTEYAYFIFCNCLPSADKRQEGSLKLLRKKFPDLYARVSHDLSACLTDNLHLTGHKQEFGMCHLETALEQYCARNGFDGLPYTAASDAIKANLQRTQSTTARSTELLMNKIELTNQHRDWEDVPIAASNSQTESFLMRVEDSASSEDILDKRSDPKRKETAFASYDADMSSETETFRSSTPLHDPLKKKAKHTEQKRYNSNKKSVKITSLPPGPDCHGPDRIFKVSPYTVIRSDNFKIPFYTLGCHARELWSREILSSLSSRPWQRQVCDRYHRRGHGRENLHGTRDEGVPTDLGHRGRREVPLYGAQLHQEGRCSHLSL